MTRRQPGVQQRKVETQPGRAAKQVFIANDRMNQMLIQHLDAAAWRAKPPGKVRNIAAIFTHMHNVRSKWVRLSAPHLKAPPLLNRAHCTPQQAAAGLAESAARCSEMLADALGGGKGKGETSGDGSPFASRGVGNPVGRGIEMFRRDGWAPAFPVGVEMLCYMLAHEAHHRGQVLMLTHQLGFPLAYEVADGIWNWERLWKECGFAGPGLT